MGESAPLVESGAKKIAVAVALILSAMALDLTSSYSSFPIGQLVVSFVLAIAGAFVGFTGLVDFLSTRF